MIMVSERLFINMMIDGYKSSTISINWTPYKYGATIASSSSANGTILILNLGVQTIGHMKLVVLKLVVWKISRFKNNIY